MQLTNEQLEMLETMGANFFPIKDIAIVIEVNEHQLKQAIKDVSTEAHKRYHKGKLLTELELRKSIVDLAKRGSNPAQKMLLELLTDMRSSNI